MRTFSFLSLLFLMACTGPEKTPEKTPQAQKFYVGTYTDKDSRGVYQYEVSDKGQMKQLALLAESENPSYLAKSADGKYLVVVNETSDENKMGGIESYAIQEDTLLKISKKSSGGAHPCFVTVNEEGYVLAANYSGGNVALLKLNEQGELKELDVQQHRGQGSTSRQEGPHAHSAYFSPINASIISADLGTNELWFSKIDGENQTLSAAGENLAMEEGAGPRHLCFHPNHKWIYVLNELNGTVTQVEVFTDGSLQTRSSTSTLRADFEGENSSADIHISSDGRFVYASNRGPNEIVIFKVEEETGKLSLLSHQPSHGDWPRNFSLSPDENFLLVAHQYSNNIACFQRDSATGLLTFVSEVKAPSPVCILF